MGDNVNRWRTVFINEAHKLSLRLNHLVVKSSDYEVEISLDEIKNILIQDDKSVITVSLLSSLSNKGIELIVVDASMMPNGVLMPLNNNARATKKKFEQIEHNKLYGDKCWQNIIKAKIFNMAVNLRLNAEKTPLLKKYHDQVEDGDKTNREGMATKYYFNHYFGSDFKRQEEDLINSCMNFTYQIVRSRISQNIIAKGYDPSFAFFHRSEYNPFCLSDDLIEVYRPIVDYYIVHLLDENEQYEVLTNSLKVKLIDVLNFKINFNGKQQTLDNTIAPYIDRVFSPEKEFIFPRLIIEYENS